LAGGSALVVLTRAPRNANEVAPAASKSNAPPVTTNPDKP
jgi:hypothetical protein